MNKHVLFVHYAQELRYRVAYSFFAYWIVFIFAYSTSHHLLFLLAKPFVCSSSTGFRTFIYTDVTEGFHVATSFAAILSALCVVPYVGYQIWCFCIPSLYQHEKRMWKHALFMCTGAQSLALFISYYASLPMLWQFFLQFESVESIFHIAFETKLSSYIRFSMSLLFFHQCLFLFPILSYAFMERYSFLAKPTDVSWNRRSIYPCIFFVLSMRGTS